MYIHFVALRKKLSKTLLVNPLNIPVSKADLKVCVGFSTLIKLIEKFVLVHAFIKIPTLLALCILTTIRLELSVL
jgi:hypothetical protein